MRTFSAPPRSQPNDPGGRDFGPVARERVFFTQSLMGVECDQFREFVAQRVTDVNGGREKRSIATTVQLPDPIRREGGVGRSLLRQSRFARQSAQLLHGPQVALTNGVVRQLEFHGSCLVA